MPVIILSTLPLDAFSLHCSYVSGDPQTSMEHIVGCFRAAGKKTIALYGVNPDSLSDIGRIDSFVRLCGIKGRNVFYNRGSLLDCYSEFMKSFEGFDSIICANDYAAISLVRRLSKDFPEYLGKLKIASFGNTRFLRCFHINADKPDIITLSINYSEFGKAALNIHDFLHRNKTVSTMHIMVKWQLRTLDGNEIPPSFDGYIENAGSDATHDDFYSDSEVVEMLGIEP